MATAHMYCMEGLELVENGTESQFYPEDSVIQTILFVP